MAWTRGKKREIYRKIDVKNISGSKTFYEDYLQRLFIMLNIKH